MQKEIPEIKTERLLLRKITLIDTPQLFELRKDEKMMRFIPRPLANTNNDVEMLIEKMLTGMEEFTSINWAITLAGNDTLVGIVGFVRMNLEHHRAEVGYMLHPKEQGKGLMAEALHAIITFGFNQMQLHTIEAVIDPANAASEQLLLKLGFIKEAHFKQNVWFNQEYLDSVHYTLFNNNNNA
jgi:[ribosomal protein S5]-alanine N-acetyltransferase